MTDDRVFTFKDPDRALNLAAKDEVKSATQAVIDEIDKSVVNARRQIFTNLVKDPGFLSTFGDDFVIEWSDFEIHTQQSVEDPLDDVTFSVHQKYRIRRRSTLEKDLIDQGLRQNPNGDLESV